MKEKVGPLTLCALLICPLLHQNAFAARNLAANQIPVGVTDVYTVDEDTQLSGNVMTNDYDPDGDAIATVPGTFDTAHGKIVLQANGSFVYIPNPNFNGFDSFEYELCDDGDPVSCCHGKIEITVVSKNDLPIANPDAYTTNEDTKLEVAKADGVLKNGCLTNRY